MIGCWPGGRPRRARHFYRRVAHVPGTQEDQIFRLEGWDGQAVGIGIVYVLGLDAVHVVPEELVDVCQASSRLSTPTPGPKLTFKSRRHTT